ncbi:MAG: aspartyl protease family protein [Acidobacteria bacterium]|nr:aspartyl protease family protein [Acidobacteriota bacterium]
MMSRNLLKKILCAIAVLLVFENGYAVSVTTNTNWFAEIPVEFTGQHILIAVKINGQGPYEMLLDTGADFCLIKMTVAQELGLQIDDKELLLGGVGLGKAKARWTKVQTLEVGEVTVKELKIMAAEITPKIKNAPVAGIIGFNFFKDKIFQIDYAAQKLRFYSSAPVKKSAAQTERRAILAMRFNGTRRIPVIDVVVNDKRLSASLDTGSASALVLFPETTKMLNLEAEANKLKPKVSFGYGGVTLTRKGEVQKLAIEKMVLEKVAAEFAMQAWDKDDSQVGNGVLKNFAVTFDYKNKLVVFEK